MRARIAVGFICLLLAGAVLCHAGQEDAVDLDSLIAEALRNNPRIQAAYNGWQAEKYRIKEVSALPDPVVRYGYFGESVETKVGPQEQKIGASFKVSFPGKLHLRGKSQARHGNGENQVQGRRWILPLSSGPDSLFSTSFVHSSPI